ncbi:hypothetical protein [Allosphingosinicella deserti]|nr:hypothetical protein [Sphingomonas deserti]
MADRQDATRLGEQVLARRNELMQQAQAEGLPCAQLATLTEVEV